jgi:antitoxin MazE
METTIKKWGNSLGIRIPKFIVKEFALKDGSLVDINDKENQIIIKTKKKNILNDLLKKINKDNIHEEFEVESPVGKEIW